MLKAGLLNADELELIKMQALNIAFDVIAETMSEKIADKLADQIKPELKSKLKDGLLKTMLSVQADRKIKKEADDQDWVIAPTPTEEESFAETIIYGNKIRINAAGTKVERKDTGGVWKSVKIQKGKDESGKDYFQIPNRNKKVSETPYLTVLVGRAILEAFVPKPPYILNIAKSKHGERILHGMRLVAYKSDSTESRLSNLAWVDEETFKKACTAKINRMKRHH